MSRLPSGDPCCWGMDGLPLLPPEWSHGLVGADIHLPAGTGRHRSAPLPVSAVTGTAFWQTRGRSWGAAPAQLAAEAAEQFLSDSSRHRWLDHHVISGPPRDTTGVLNIPFLRGTRDSLAAAGLWSGDLGWVLGTISALELWQLLDDVTAVVDVVVTSRSWVHDGFVERPVLPERESVFELAAERFLAMAGVPIASTKPNLGSDKFRDALGGRAALRNGGRLTLEESGGVLGVTRERIRQIGKRFDLAHTLHRAWPDGGLIGELLDGQEVERESVMRVAAEYQPEVSVEERLKKLRDASMTSADRDRDLRLVTERCWELSDGTGFFRIPDAVEHFGDELGSSGAPLATLIHEASSMIDLPYDTAFTQYNSRDPWIVTTSHRILGHLGPLSVHKLRIGLQRRCAGRTSNLRGAGPPAADILLAFYAAHPDFSVTGDVISSNRVDREPADSVQGWILRQIAAAGGVAHRTTLLALARRDRKNRSSVTVNLTVFGYLIEPVGGGCFTSLGYPYSPTDVELARRYARTISIPTTGKEWAVTSNDITFECSIGTNLLDTGVLPVPSRVARLIGDQQLSVHSRLGTHGHIALTGTNLYGLSSVFQALDAAPGDLLTMRLDISQGKATVTVTSD